MEQKYQASKESQNKIQPSTVEQAASQEINLDASLLPGMAVGPNVDPTHRQTTLLFDHQFDPAFRQRIVTQISQFQGNRHLQRLLARPPRVEISHRTLAGLIQLSMLSDELSELWPNKRAFFTRLRELDELERADEDLNHWAEENLRSGDLWLTENILTYGPEANWPIHLRVEVEMKDWPDSGGPEVVFQVLRAVGGAEANNAELTEVLEREFANDPDNLQLALRLQQNQRQPSAAMIEGNIMELTTTREGNLDEPSIRRLQARLIELGCLSTDTGGFIWGELTDATRNAIRRFQASHAAEIQEVISSSEALEARGAGPAGARGGTEFHEGRLIPDDATQQVMANAWPRRFFGVLIENEAQAFEYIAGQIEYRNLPFDRSRVNIVGIRGFQGGGTHENVGERRRTNIYDDSFFVMAMNADGQPMLREFRGTTDPGGRSQQRGGPRLGEQDPRTYRMGSDQQLPYRFRWGPGGYKANRPTLELLTGTEEEPQVVDPSREAILAERGRMTTERRRRGTHRQAELAEGAGDEESPLYHRLRTEVGAGEHQRLVGRAHGIAIHSGWGGRGVTAESTGCQVVHGDWYGNFLQVIRRALSWERIRNGVDVPENPEQLADEGEVLYSLLDGRDLLPPLERQRQEQGGEATAARPCQLTAPAEGETLGTEPAPPG